MSQPSEGLTSGSVQPYNTKIYISATQLLLHQQIHTCIYNPAKMDSPNPWNLAQSHSGLVSAGAHSLFLSVAGPPRDPLKPVVLVESGIADCSNAWPALVRLVSQFARVYTYDRAGWGRSSNIDSSTGLRTATAIANELSSLLQAVGVTGPYILVGHSYGGILVREFFALRPRDCVGFVFVDAVMEDDLKINWPYPAMHGMLGSLDMFEVTGLVNRTKLTPEEWEAFEQGEHQPRNGESSAAEFGALRQTGEDLVAKHQLQNYALEDRPVSVIRAHRELDWQKVYEAGLREGNGTDEQRRTLGDFLKRMGDICRENQTKQLKISRNSRMVEVPDCGHQVNQERPDVVADEIKWILESYVG
jgi:pimeloyl-ACP methyl ester carboxylesterase